MRRRLATLGLIAIAALIIWITANTIIKMGGQVQLQETFARALSKRDAAAIGAVSLDSEAARIGETLRQTYEGERWLMHPGEAG